MFYDFGGGIVGACDAVELDKEVDGVEEVVDEGSVVGLSDDFIVDDDDPWGKYNSGHFTAQARFIKYGIVSEDLQ